MRHNYKSVVERRNDNDGEVRCIVYHVFRTATSIVSLQACTLHDELGITQNNMSVFITATTGTTINNNYYYHHYHHHLHPNQVNRS